MDLSNMIVFTFWTSVTEMHAKNEIGKVKQWYLTSARLIAPLQGFADTAAPVQQAVRGQDAHKCTSKNSLWAGAVGWQGLPGLLTIQLAQRRKRSHWESTIFICLERDLKNYIWWFIIILNMILNKSPTESPVKITYVNELQAYFVRFTWYIIRPEHCKEPSWDLGMINTIITDVMWWNIMRSLVQTVLGENIWTQQHSWIFTWGRWFNHTFLRWCKIKQGTIQLSEWPLVLTLIIHPAKHTGTRRRPQSLFPAVIRQIF